MNTPIIPQPQSESRFRPLGLLSMVRNFFQPQGGLVQPTQADLNAMAEAAKARLNRISELETSLREMTEATKGYVKHIGELESALREMVEAAALKAKKTRKPRAKPTANDDEL